jgi:hypothetical protein
MGFGRILWDNLVLQGFGFGVLIAVSFASCFCCWFTHWNDSASGKFWTSGFAFAFLLFSMFSPYCLVVDFIMHCINWIFLFIKYYHLCKNCWNSNSHCKKWLLAGPKSLFSPENVCVDPWQAWQTWSLKRNANQPFYYCSIHTNWWCLWWGRAFHHYPFLFVIGYVYLNSWTEFNSCVSWYLSFLFSIPQVHCDVRDRLPDHAMCMETDYQ